LDNELTGETRELILYGEELIAHTAQYLGPNGSVAQLTNGMNCQNCHLDAGSRPWGNNYGGVYSTYPKFRDRSGGIESIYKRVSDCMERSLNGKAIDSNSREFKAIYAYIKWLGKDVKKGVKPWGAGIEKLAFLERPADPLQGREVYLAKCQSCHLAGGEGQKLEHGNGYVYPPLWGDHSYNDGAGLFRISNFAGFVRNNMPFNQASRHAPQLTDQECWDVAAYVNSQPRPHKDQITDWPNRTKKPVDFPFGPYSDPFSEKQHKYGPYPPIIAFYKKNSN
jgi:thiosulfate dehydrogenase